MNLPTTNGNRPLHRATVEPFTQNGVTGIHIELPEGVELPRRNGAEPTLADLISMLQNNELFGGTAPTSSGNNGLERLSRVLESWQQQAQTDITVRPEQWNLSSEQYNDIAEFLSRLQNSTADATSSNRSVRSLHSQRVVNFIQQLELNQDGFRDVALERIGEALSSCVDRVALLMNDIDVEVAIRKAKQSRHPVGQLKQLAFALMVLNVAKQHAIRKCNELTRQGAHFDPIEVHLGYEAAVSRAFRLPVGAREMMFNSGLERGEIASCIREARNLVNNRQARVDFRANWAPWQQFQRQQQAEQAQWRELPLQANDDFTAESTCLITQEPLSNLREPIIVNGHLYELQDFMTWWGEHGTDPIDRNQSVSFSQIKRVSTMPERQAAERANTSRRVDNGQARGHGYGSSRKDIEARLSDWAMSAASEWELMGRLEVLQIMSKDVYLDSQGEMMLIGDLILAHDSQNEFIPPVKITGNIVVDESHHKESVNGFYSFCDSVYNDLNYISTGGVLLNSGVEEILRANPDRRIITRYFPVYPEGTDYILSHLHSDNTITHHLLKTIPSKGNPKLIFADPRTGLSSKVVHEPDVANYIKNRFLDAD